MCLFDYIYFHNGIFEGDNELVEPAIMSSFADTIFLDYCLESII